MREEERIFFFEIARSYTCSRDCVSSEKKLYDEKVEKEESLFDGGGMNSSFFCEFEIH
jgi:hypothetical protein